MIIKDPVTCESLVRDNYPRMPDDGCDHTNCHLDRLHAARRARKKSRINLPLNQRKRGSEHVRTIKLFTCRFVSKSRSVICGVFGKKKHDLVINSCQLSLGRSSENF